jgi:L-lactate dehydrogenase complex protein LldG
MSSARDQILSRIRAALGRDELPAGQLAGLRERIARHSRHIEPAISESPGQRFRQKLEAAEASVAEVDSIGAVAAEVGAYLDRLGVEKKLLAGSDALLRQIEWPPSIEVAQRSAGGDDRVSITAALYGICETGTLMLVSSEDSPTSLNFLPDYHIVVLSRDRLVLRMEDAWDGLRAKMAQLPRTVNFISGPSKTADIEQTVEYGAHGPRSLHVILID